MPTSRTLSAVLLGAVLATGCAASAGEDVETSDGALGVDVTGAGIVDKTPDAEGVLIYANDRAATADTLTQAGVNADVAKSIIAARTASDGTPHWFASLDEVDALPNTDANAFKALLAGAKAIGDEELPGFETQNLAKISVPDNLGRPPTSNDVTVEAGYDGLTPEQAYKISRSRLTNIVDPSNEDITHSRFLDNFKMFTIGIGNLFVANSPDATWLQGRIANATSVMMVGTMQMEHSNILVIAHGRQVDQYSRGPDGTYVLMQPNNVPVVMRAKLNLDPNNQGTRIFYPAWSAKQLAHATTVTEEP